MKNFNSYPYEMKKLYEKLHGFLYPKSKLANFEVLISCWLEHFIKHEPLSSREGRGSK